MGIIEVFHPEKIAQTKVNVEDMQIILSIESCNEDKHTSIQKRKLYLQSKDKMSVTLRAYIVSKKTKVQNTRSKRN